MKVIFIEDVLNVAEAGEIKNVAKGFARNYLFPKNFAVAATPSELQRLESRRKQIAKQKAQKEESASALAEKLNKLNLVIKVKAGEKGRIYGSVTNADIAKAIIDTSGHDIDKRIIDLTEPIRQLGNHQIPIKFTKNIVAKINVTIEQDGQLVEQVEVELQEQSLLTETMPAEQPEE